MHVEPTREAPLSLRSSAFLHGAEIPRRHTCEGHDVSPALGWGPPPPGTRSLALIVDDPDAPDPAAPLRVWVHWLLYNIPPDARGCDEGALPRGATLGRNDWDRLAWGGPCPPVGRHRYFFRLYALDTTLPLHRPTRHELDRAMRGHVLASATLMGTYQKHG